MLGECGRCDVAVDAVVEGQYSFRDEDGPLETVVLARCPRCSEPIVVRYDEIEGLGHLVQIFPAPERPLSRSVPTNIRDGFQEARDCFRAAAYTATALMCRRTLEAIARYHDVNERTLAASLRAMKDRGIIETRLFEWAEALRLVGNEAAHDVVAGIHGQDAQDAVEFTNALLEYLYTFRDRFEAFKVRRQRADGV